MISILIKSYDMAIKALASIAAALMAMIFIAVVYDVLVRLLGFQPPFWTSALTEYALLYITLLGAPWVLRKKGHVFIISFSKLFPANVRWIVGKLVYILCIIICITLCYYSTKMGLDIAMRGEQDIRSIVAPKWILFAGLPVCFIFMCLEFFRFLIGKDDMYSNGG